MASFKQMRLDGVTKRAEAAFIEYKNIHIEPGFNPSGRTEENDEDDKELFDFIMSGNFSKLPAWEVRPRDDGGVWAVDCHRRYVQTGKAIEAGAPLADKDGKIWVPIVQFVGNDLDRLTRLATSNKKKPLKSHQFAEICKRMRGFNQSPEDIARLLCCSRPRIDQALILADSNSDVQEAVKTGVISATEAVKQVRKHGEKAGAVIKKAVAQAPNKGKVTAAAFTPTGPNAQTEILRKALFLVHATLVPYVDSKNNMHIDDLNKLQGAVAKALRDGAAK